MSDTKIAELLDGIGIASPTNHAIVLALRALVRQAAPGADEMVKYGGLHYVTARPIGGIFAYGGHVSLEFSRGAELEDAAGMLQGDGKYRRHLKFTTPEAIDADVVLGFMRDAVARA